MRNWDIQQIIDILEQGAGIAMDYYEAPSARLKSDLSIVTEADHAIEHAFGEVFDSPETGSYLIGEETVHTKDTDYLDAALNEVAWIVDPIDGTAPYAHHIPTWGISLARMENGTITDGAIYLPITNEMFVTDGEEILYGPPKELAPLTVVRRRPDNGGMIALTQSVVKLGTFKADNPVQALACAVLPLTYLLLGRYIGYQGTVKLWDVAGALAMLTRAGFSCVLMNGTTVGAAVTDEVYHLDAKSPRRWFLRDRLICGPSPEAVDYLMAASSDR
jgi:myo-inositol-1(or 4)-monophosphatase